MARERGVVPKGRGISAPGNGKVVGSTAKQKYENIVSWIGDTTETQKDIRESPGMIAAAGRKYGQDPSADIKAYKTSIRKAIPEKVPATWGAPSNDGAGYTSRNTSGISGAGAKNVNKIYRPMGNK